MNQNKIPSVWEFERGLEKINQNEKSLTERITDLCVESCLTYEEVRRALKDAELELILRAETLIRNANIMDIVEQTKTPYVNFTK